MAAAPPPCAYGRPTWAEIDLGALLHNYHALRSLLSPNRRSTIKDRGSKPDSACLDPPSSIFDPRVIPVIKADAYGHGAAVAARALADAGARCLAVALVEEAVSLREAGVKEEILVLEGCWPGQEEEILRHRLVPGLHSVEGVRRLAEASRTGGRPLGVQLKVDTGMNRLGVPWDAMDPVLETLQKTAALRLRGTFSHLACAEEEDPSFTREQTDRFRRAVARMRTLGLHPGELHLANSAGLLYHAELRSMSARPGIALYGYAPRPERPTVELKQVMRLKSRIGQVRIVPPSDTVGYNRRFIAPRTTRAATLPVGYADGYRRSLAGIGKVIARDRTVPVIGSVNMDMIVIDVTDLPEVQEGEEVILLGSGPNCSVDAAVWAEWLGTNPYEVLCGISSRVPRVYLA